MKVVLYSPTVRDMNHRSENSVQTVVRWGRNVLIGVGVLSLVAKVAEEWFDAVWRLSPGLRRRMSKNCGQDIGRINFLASGVASVLTAPLWLFCALVVVSLVVEILGLGEDFLRWETNFFTQLELSVSPSTILLWIAFAFLSPWMLAALRAMLVGIVASIRPNNRRCRARPPVSRFTLHLCFYLLAIPMFGVISMVDQEPFIYSQRAWFLILMVSLWTPMLWLCDMLMRHTGRVGRLVTAAVLAVAFTPVAARLIGLTGFYSALYDALHSLG